MYTVPKNRIFSIDLVDKEFHTPFFFPSISIAKPGIYILDCLDMIKKTGYPGFLVSAYDIENIRKEYSGKLIDLIEKTSENSIFFLDNGNYESWQLKNKEWSFSKFETVLGKLSPDFCFSFDIFWKEDIRIKEHIDQTIKNILKTAAYQKTGTIVPLIHSDRKNLLEVVKKVVESVNPEIIGLTERELGNDIVERSESIKSVRKVLDSMDYKIPIHILGTGNPISISIYTLCGADMFDGTEWMEYVINPKTFNLMDFSLRKLLGCKCKACSIEDISYNEATLAHNLNHYKIFIEGLSENIKKGTEKQFLEKYIDKETFQKISSILKD